MCFAALSPTPWPNTSPTRSRLHHGVPPLHQLCCWILSVDAVGAFDHVSGRARGVTIPASALFARQFYGSESSSVWTDDARTEHVGKLGDPLMPPHDAVAQHDALHHFASALEPSECFFFSMILTSSAPLIAFLPCMARSAMRSGTTGRNPDQGKIRVRNAAVEEPPNIAAFQPDPSSAADIGVGGPNAAAEEAGPGQQQNCIQRLKTMQSTHSVFC